MSVTAAAAKACCADAYASDAALYLLGDSFHPGGAALTAELARELGVGPGSVVADVASGRGTSAVLLSRSTGCTVVALDLAPTGAAAASTLARELGLQRSVRGVCADAEALPLADASLDGILCECAFCLFPDKAAAAAEIARVLRPNARLALSDVTADRSRLPAELLTLEGHVACLADARPLEETAALIEAAGLTILSVQRRDDVLVPLLERIAARVRLARLIGGGPLAGLIDSADALLRAARSAVRDGTIGYGVVIARR